MFLCCTKRLWWCPTVSVQRNTAVYSSDRLQRGFPMPSVSSASWFHEILTALSRLCEEQKTSNKPQRRDLTCFDHLIHSKNRQRCGSDFKTWKWDEGVFSQIAVYLCWIKPHVTGRTEKMNGPFLKEEGKKAVLYHIEFDMNWFLA